MRVPPAVPSLDAFLPPLDMFSISHQSVLPCPSRRRMVSSTGGSPFSFATVRAHDLSTRTRSPSPRSARICFRSTSMFLTNAEPTLTENSMPTLRSSRTAAWAGFWFQAGSRLREARCRQAGGLSFRSTRMLALDQVPVQARVPDLGLAWALVAAVQDLRASS